jgi:DNA-directed RNA polymerase, mitochondrial
MFRGAHEIQEWLTECARRISRSVSPSDFARGETTYLSSIIWTSPMGLPVCQPYRKDDVKDVNTFLSRVTISNPNRIGPVNGRKQTTAFPPNFVHSLDASHMLKSAIACHDIGLTFAAVHDSFWTHACDVDTMGIILREAFVRMHESDLVAKLKEEFEARYKGYYYRVRDSEAQEQVVEGKDERNPTRIKWKPLEFPLVPQKV